MRSTFHKQHLSGRRGGRQPFPWNLCRENLNFLQYSSVSFAQNGFATASSSLFPRQRVSITWSRVALLQVVRNGIQENVNLNYTWEMLPNLNSIIELFLSTRPGYINPRATIPVRQPPPPPPAKLRVQRKAENKPRMRWDTEILLIPTRLNYFPLPIPCTVTSHHP